MGRAKLKMELIENKKSRVLSFQKRKLGLIKKLHELSTLCAVPACMIIHHPSQPSSSPSLWPENSPDQVRRLIDTYNKSKNKSPGGVKTYGLSDFFDDRHKEIEAELLKLRNKNSEAKYPTWAHCFSAMDEPQLRNLGAQLRLKAQTVRSRIHFLRDKSTNYDPHFYHQHHNNFNFFPSAAARIPMNYCYHDLPPLPEAPPPQQQYYPPLAMDQYGNYYSMDQNLNYWALP